MLLRERRLTLSEIKFLPGEGLEPQVVKGRGRRSLTGLDAATALDLLKQVKDGELKRGQIKRAIKAKLI